MILPRAYRRRESFLAERLKGARSNLAAQQCEESMPSGSGRADPSCGGPAVEAGTVSLAHHCVWFGRTPSVQAPRLGRAALAVQNGIIYIQLYTTNLACILDFAGLAVLVEHVHGGTG